MKPQFVAGNQLTLLNSGAEYFPALIAAIDSARARIQLETYIFADDHTGRAVAAALAQAARRGVEVRVLVDGFGGGAFPRTLMPSLIEAGVNVMIYRPELFRLGLQKRRLRRLHRKMSLFDGRTAFIGGINILDDLGQRDSITEPRFDFAVRIEGALAESIRQAMDKLWETVAWVQVHHRVRLPAAPASPMESVGEASAALVIRDNIRHRRDIEDAYVDAMRLAQREILIANAYFLPSRRFQDALAQAARRGVSVTVLLEGRAEYRLFYYATQSLYGELLAAGVRIFEYDRSFLHAKVAVIDTHWATVGSSNIDPFSLLVAQEANVVTRSREFATKLRDSLLDAIRIGAHELNPEDWRRASLGLRLVRWISYRLTRLILAAVGYGPSR